MRYSERRYRAPAAYETFDPRTDRLARNFTEQAHHNYQRWRETVPWTDDQILAAFDKLLECYEPGFCKDRQQRWRDQFARHRCLSGRLLSLLLPVLIETCAICGKKALYRTGNEGRCRDHRMIPSGAVAVKHARIEQRNQDISITRKNGDEFDKAETGLHRAKKRWRGHR